MRGIMIKDYRDLDSSRMISYLERQWRNEISVGKTVFEVAEIEIYCERYSNWGDNRKR